MGEQLTVRRGIHVSKKWAGIEAVRAVKCRRRRPHAPGGVCGPLPRGGGFGIVVRAAGPGAKHALHPGIRGGMDSRNPSTPACEAGAYPEEVNRQWAAPKHG